MMINSVDFMPQRDVLKLTPSHNTAIISIHDVGEEFEEKKIEAWGVDYKKYWGSWTSFAFEDAAYNEDMIKQYGKEFNKYFADCFTPDMALDMLEEIVSITTNPQITQIIVHCDSGRSRSAAVAKFLNDKYHIPVLRDIEYPNSLVTKLLNDPACYDQTFEEYVHEPVVEAKIDNPTGNNDLITKLSKILTAIFGK